MKPITVSVTVDRPREWLFEQLADLRWHEQFTDHFLCDYSGTADKVRVRASTPGPAQWADIASVEQVRPSRLVERGIGAAGKRETRGTYELAEAGPGRTDVTFTLEFLRTPVAERVMAPFLSAYMKRANARAMERLKAVAEGGAASAAA
jgi:hypothetical protein